MRQLIDKESKKMNAGEIDKKALMTARGGFFPEIDEKYRKKEQEPKLRPLRSSRKKESMSSTNLRMLG